MEKATATCARHAVMVMANMIGAMVLSTSLPP
jgi:hypothetical protein